MRYVALLRAINVGGNSMVKMAELKACVAGLGHADVRTYIASGNVLFDSPERSGAWVRDGCASPWRISCAARMRARSRAG